ncbi:MAG TPA: sulfatase-like hydrolase/transferase, partial [Polyangiales bacterium]|nr:sulfatase-like hydrolase/transferase [Polyangiales bacterium]
ADRIDWRALRFSGDVLVLLVAWLALQRVRHAHLRTMGRICLGLVTIVLSLYQVDVAASRVFMRHAPELYDQMFLLGHVGVLAMDLWGGWGAFGVALGLALLLGLLVWLVRRLLRGLLPLAARSQSLSPNEKLVVAASAALVLLASLPAIGAVEWLTPSLARDIGESVELSRAIASGLHDSPYKEYARLKLTRKPRVLLFFVESYGRVMASDGSMRGLDNQVLSRLERVLSKNGWHFASAYSEAPISGGRSWLAHASVLTGIQISYQALFQRVFAGGHVQVPNLVSFLQGQGYDTLLLSPVDRERPGVRVENYYAFQRTLGAKELDYHGPTFGWGVIPDQLSMLYAHDHVLSKSREALFFMFSMVSSHAPWTNVPRIVPHGRDVNDYLRLQMTSPVLADPKLPSQGTWFRHLERYSHALRLSGQSESRPQLRAAYARSIAYDLDLIARELVTLRGDDLVIIMGDHQPPLVTAEVSDTAVPVHVLARDPNLLAELLVRGFSPGLRIPARQRARLGHEGLFSLLVRSLALTCAPGSPPPAFLPRGQHLLH